MNDHIKVFYIIVQTMFLKSDQLLN